MKEAESMEQPEKSTEELVREAERCHEQYLWFEATIEGQRVGCPDITGVLIEP